MNDGRVGLGRSENTGVGIGLGRRRRDNVTMPRLSPRRIGEGNGGGKEIRKTNGEIAEGNTKNSLSS